MRRAIIALGVLLAAGPGAWALDPALDVSQYAHTAWTVRDGFAKGVIHSIAQTADGYLWLATDFGLLRFDGVRAVPWEPPADQHLPSSQIYSLLAARDRTLWIGTSKGLASWKDGKLTQYAEFAGQYVWSLLEDREGTVWAGGFSLLSPGKLCAIRTDSVHCSGEDRALGPGVLGFFEDSKGNLWVKVSNGLWRWKPGPPKFYPLPGETALLAMAEDDNGGLLIGTRSGIRQFVDGKTEAYPPSGPVRQSASLYMLRDHDGGLWIGTYGGGVEHVHQGRRDLFAQSDGLSGNETSALFEDREGTVWVATLTGLDRFRELAVATVSTNQGLSVPPGSPVLAARDGSVWFATLDGLNKWKNGQITLYGKRGARSPRSVTGMTAREITSSGVPTRVGCLFQDGHGRIWVTTLGKFGYLENDRFTSVSAVPGGVGGSIAEDTAGNLWIASQDLGLSHLLQGRVVERIPWTGLGHKDPATALAAGPSQGALWVGFVAGGVEYFVDGHVRASYSVADGLGAGWVSDLRLDPDGAVWAATEGGLSRLKDGHVATLTSKNGLPCDAVQWGIEDDAHSVWLKMACGLVRIGRSELDAWAAAVDKDKDTNRKMQVAVFDSFDGVSNLARASGLSPHVAKSSDGRLWYTGFDGLSVIDPRHLPFNKLSPPVHIEQITADHKSYEVSSAVNGGGKEHLRLPPLVRDLEIDYTALSLVAPEKVLFRYKLEGWDRDWQDAGNRRQAFYNNLSPGKYRFRVSACNNSGVWNEAGTFLDFSVAPAYYQTTWFRLSCVAAFVVLLWALYQLRLRQVARQFNMRLEERVGERTRIARDLHDTLLQSFQGLLLRFQAATNLLPESPEEAKRSFESAIEQAAQAITEGRDAVQGLRSSTKVTNDLAMAISALSEELGCGETNPNCAEFDVEVEGTPRDLHPILRDEVYRIAGEAVRNAFKHAQAERVEVEIRYDEKQLRLRVRDDGKGIDAKLLNEGGRAGHYGLPGMRERAKLMGGKLAVWSEADVGTEVELKIPASRAYESSPARRRWWVAEKFSGRDTEVKS